MKEIQLTRGKIAVVDDEDYEKLNQFKWHAVDWGSSFYAVKWGSSIHGKRNLLIMHREIMNTPKHLQIDHINGNGLDNRKENLRICTNQQNCFNRKHSSKNNKLRIKGVYWNKIAKKFQSQIKINDKKIHLGYFNVLGDADSAYRIAEEKYFGEFARKI